MARTPPGYYLHLIAWAQIGVLIRVYFAELFGSACPSVHWAPCLTSNGSRWGGAFFTDLPSNIFGSFLMGLFVSSDVLSNSLKHTLTVEAPLAMLPTWSPLQQHLAFQVGLRTGLCGSLTTFASWLTQMVIMMVGGKTAASMHHTQWVEALGGLLVGTLAALAALVLGQHLALLIYHKLNPGAFIPYGSPAPEQAKLETDQPEELQELTSPPSITRLDMGRLRTVSSYTRGNTTVVVVDSTAATGLQPAATAAEATAAAGGAAGYHLPVVVPAGSVELAATQHQTPTLQSLASGLSQQPPMQQHQQLPQSSDVAAEAMYSSQSISGAADGSAATPFGAAAVQGSAAALTQQQQQQHGAASFAALNGTAPGRKASVATEATTVIEEVEEPSVSLSERAVDVFAVLTIAVLTGISLWRIIQGSTGDLTNKAAPFSPQWFWWSIVFGPLGCYLRYYLSRYNVGVLHGHWKWFPLGTFTANMAACILDYVMKVLPVRTALDSVALDVLAGVVGGVGGCLSTVSTWVVEVQRLLLSFPHTYHGYQYVSISLVTALLFGFIIYGIPVWTLGV